MDDDVYCLFITVACVLTLAMPEGGQVLFAGFAMALVVAARVVPHRRNRPGPDRRDRHGTSA